MTISNNKRDNDIQIITVAVGNINYEYNGEDIKKYTTMNEGRYFEIVMKDGTVHKFYNAAIRVTFRRTTNHHQYRS